MTAEDEARRIAELEVENGLRQYDLAIDAIKSFQERDRPFSLRSSLIQQLQETAVKGIEAHPGEWRTGPVSISKSKHSPPPAHLVKFLVEEMCDHVNDNWHERTAFYLSSYVMWRLNWIHPFEDGNGRTSRIISYIVLSAKLNTILPGVPTVVQQIQNDRTAYFRALDQADAAARAGQVDVSEMEAVIRGMLATQLLSIIHEADGGSAQISD
jgi:Fic family protein